MDEQRQDDQLEPIYNNCVPIQDVVIKTYWLQWNIEKSGERRSALVTRHDDEEFVVRLVNFVTFYFFGLHVNRDGCYQ